MTDLIAEKRFSPSDVATILGMSKRWVLKQIEAGRLPAERYGREWRVIESDLRAFIAARRPTLAPSSSTPTSL